MAYSGSDGSLSYLEMLLRDTLLPVELLPIEHAEWLIWIASALTASRFFPETRSLLAA
jgi:hypothetical protein